MIKIMFFILFLKKKASFGTYNWEFFFSFQYCRTEVVRIGLDLHELRKSIHIHLPLLGIASLKLSYD